jgi:hypothetical protein
MTRTWEPKARAQFSEIISIPIVTTLFPSGTVEIVRTATEEKASDDATGENAEASVG